MVGGGVVGGEETAAGVAVRVAPDGADVVRIPLIVAGAGPDTHRGPDHDDWRQRAGCPPGYGGLVRTRLLEREAELRALTRQVRAVRAGAGQVIVVDGPAIPRRRPPPPRPRSRPAGSFCRCRRARPLRSPARPRRALLPPAGSGPAVPRPGPAAARAPAHRSPPGSRPSPPIIVVRATMRVRAAPTTIVAPGWRIRYIRVEAIFEAPYDHGRAQAEFFQHQTVPAIR